MHCPHNLGVIKINSFYYSLNCDFPTSSTSQGFKDWLQCKGTIWAIFHLDGSGPCSNKHFIVSPNTNISVPHIHLDIIEYDDVRSLHSCVAFSCPFCMLIHCHLN